MTSSLLFLLSAARAISEMLGLCLLAQAAMYVLLGHQRGGNPIYRLFSLLTAAPRKVARIFLPRALSEPLVAAFCFLVLFAIWLGLAILRKFI